METVLTRAALQSAMANDELLLFYQPKVCLLRGSLLGAEALVRWNTGDSEIVSPSDFLPLAEETGLLHDITLNLLEQVVRACGELRQVQPGLSISINVAPNDLVTRTISGNIRRYLADGVIAKRDLQIEITESAAMGNAELIRDELIELTRLGIKVLMDDFGTGYSSIDRLSQLPFSSLKLDQGVVRRMGTSRQNLTVVKSAISMARELRMTSIAEGIETAGAYNFLIANGCEEAQGYYIGRPMALADFLSFVRDPPRFEGSQIGRVHQAIYNVLFDRQCLVDAAFCARLDRASTLPSVVNPGISDRAEDSRSGVWYYGIGQQLAHLDSFVRLEAPLRELHVIAGEFLQMLSHDERQVDAAIADVDAQVNSIIQLLHALERDLLRAARGQQPAH